MKIWTGLRDRRKTTNMSPLRAQPTWPDMFFNHQVFKHVVELTCPSPVWIVSLEKMCRFSLQLIQILQKFTDGPFCPSHASSELCEIFLDNVLSPHPDLKCALHNFRALSSLSSPTPENERWCIMVDEDIYGFYFASSRVIAYIGTWMRHGVIMNGMNKECMLGGLFGNKQTHIVYQVAREGDTCTCMNYQPTTKTIKNFLHLSMRRWSYDTPRACSSLSSTTALHGHHHHHEHTNTIVSSHVMSHLGHITIVGHIFVINVI